jgi:hypothetical protein
VAETRAYSVPPGTLASAAGLPLASTAPAEDRRSTVGAPLPSPAAAATSTLSPALALKRNTSALPPQIEPAVMAPVVGTAGACAVVSSGSASSSVQPPTGATVTVSR